LWERALPAKGATPRQDPRGFSNDGSNNASGIPRGSLRRVAKATLSRMGPALTRPVVTLRGLQPDP